MSNNTGKYVLLRLLPVILVSVAAAFWFNDVQEAGPYVLRNLIPLVLLVLLSGVTLYLGGGRWTGLGKRLPLGIAGYAIPALGLSLYLHYAYLSISMICSQTLISPTGFFATCLFIRSSPAVSVSRSAG